MKYLLLFFILLLHCLQLKSQDQSVFQLMERRDVKLDEIENLAKQQFSKTGTGRGTGYKQFQRWLYEKKFHVDEQGYIIPPQVEWGAYQQGVANMGSPSALSCTNNFKNYWIEKGPFGIHPTSSWSPGNGRLFSFAIHPSDENTIYVGSPAGGIWKTTNGGATWTCLLQFYGPWIKVYSIAIDPLNQNIVYAGVGEGTSNLIKSTDGGLHWDSLQVTTAGKIRKILVLPTTPSIVFACDNLGVLRSGNAGQTWSRVCGNHKEDIEVKPNNIAIMYTCGNQDAQRSTDTGKTWTPILGIDITGRKQLAVTEDNPDIVYLIRSTSDQLNFGTLYKSFNSGNLFIPMVTGNPSINTAYFGYSHTADTNDGQAFHDMAICVSPDNEDEVYIGAILCWKSIDGGSSFTCKTFWYYPNLMGLGYNHADIHGLQLINNHLYSISDGGLYRSNDFGTTWVNLSKGLAIRQFYKIAGSSLNTNIFTGGTYDNGSTCYSDSLRDWLGADGGEGLTSSSNPLHIWGSSQNGVLYRTIDGGLNKEIIDTIPGSNWITPFAMHPTSDNILFAGSDGIYMSTNFGYSFTKISGTTIVGTVKDISIASSNPSYIYASTNSILYVSTNFGGSWLPQSVNGNITDICVSKFNPEKIWITTMNPNRVYVSYNHGQSFQNITGLLPNISAKAIVVDESNDTTLYVAMNWGIFTRSTQQPAWIEITENLPRVEIMELDFQTNFHKLRVATFGRGLWEAQAGAIASVQISVVSGSLSGCIGDDIIFQAIGINEGSTPLYEWKVNGISVGNNSPYFTLHSSQANEIITCVLHSSLSYALPSIVESNSLTTLLHPKPEVIINNPFSICKGDSVLLNSNASAKKTQVLSSQNMGGTISKNGYAFTIDNMSLESLDIISINAYIECATYAEVWYKAGSLNMSPLVNSFGWTQLGNTLSILPSSKTKLTKIPISLPLTLLPYSSYSLLIICDGMMYGDSLGASNNMADSNLNIDIGICGSGEMGGIFNFSELQNRWNGQIIYQKQTAINSYTWVPTYQMNNANSSNPFVSPDSSIWYTLDVQDNNGCISTSSVYVPVNPLPNANNNIVAGIASITPSSICKGENALLQFEPVLCATSNGFIYAQQNGPWNIVDTTISPFLGNIFINNDSMILSGGVGQMGIILSCSGILSFDWRMTPGINSIAPLDTPKYAINFNQIPFSGFNPNLIGVQSGTISMPVNAGDTFSFFIYPSLNYPYGFIDVGIRNFKLPVSGFNLFYPLWYDTPEGGTPITYLYGQPDSAIFKPIQSGHKKYYAQIINTQTGCYSSDRIPTNTIDINALPTLSVNASPNMICEGDSTQLNAIANSIETDSIPTQKLPDVTILGNAFDVVANKPITIKKLKMLLTDTVSEVEVWYKPGGYGNADFLSSTLWTKLGNTVSVTWAGANTFTEILINTQLNIPMGQTYGIAIVCNGNAFAGNGTSVGDILMSNSDIIIKQGHGGSGFGGNFNFTISPIKWNGEIVYDVNNILSSYTWTPNNFLNNPNISNPKASPLHSTVYSIQVEDSNACKQQKNIQVFVKSQAVVGNVVATPSTLCNGDSLQLHYNYNSGLVCNGSLENGFAGIYAPINWTLTQNNSNGSVVSSSAPFSIQLVSSNGLIGAGYTNYSVNILCDGILSFNWNYNNTDYPSRDYPKYSLDGINFLLLPGFDTSNFTLINTGSSIQQGILQINVIAGQTFTLQLYTVDNLGDGFNFFVYNFSAPKQNFVSQTVQWYDAQVGGNYLGNINPLHIIPSDTGALNYFAQITNSANGCVTNSRASSNTINNLESPQLNITSSANSICDGDSVILSASGANTYYWEPGSFAGSTVVVSPSTTTIYTITASNANGCSKTSTIIITVNSLPNVTAIASDTVICIGDSAQLNGFGAFTYEWQPGNIMNASPLIYPISSTTFTLTGTDINGCQSNAMLTIVVNPLPNATITTINASICLNDSTSLTGFGGHTYLWQPSGLTTNTISVSPLMNTIYTLTIVDTLTGCSNYSTSNITVNPLPSVSITPTPAIVCSGQSITLHANGASNYLWQPGNMNGSNVTVSPLSNTVYTITSTNANGCSKISTHEVVVNNCGYSNLEIKCFIEGFYSSNGNMLPVLQLQGVAGAPNNVCDSITVELRNPNPPYQMTHSLKTILYVDGHISCNFSATGNYYLAIKHRNGVQTWSATPITLSGAPISYDFSDALNKAYGNNQVALGGGVFGFYSGDINADENVDLLDFSLLDVDINNFAFGYFATDVNGDGNVDLLDAPIVETNIINFIFSNHP